MSAQVMFISFRNQDDTADEAAATRHGPDKQLLPDGQWYVRHKGQDKIMAEADMPVHWREQLQKWSSFMARFADAKERMDDKT
jgi:hypothetical protein